MNLKSLIDLQATMDKAAGSTCVHSSKTGLPSTVVFHAEIGKVHFLRGDLVETFEIVYCTEHGWSSVWMRMETPTGWYIGRIGTHDADQILDLWRGLERPPRRKIERRPAPRFAGRA